jgi:dTMP kinase
LFITFEGIEGCGKSTQAGRLAARLQHLGTACVFTREPGGTAIGRKIRHILLDQDHQDLPPLSELFLYEADRALHMELVIRPALARRQWVICDRFFDATTVYQGYARGQDLEMIRFLNQKASFGITPDLTLLIDCPVEVGIARALKRNASLEDPGQDRFEKENTAFHAAVRKGYLLMAEKEPDRFVVVDGALGENELEEIILDHVRPHLKESRS